MLKTDSETLTMCKCKMFPVSNTCITKYCYGVCDTRKSCKPLFLTNVASYKSASYDSQVNQEKHCFVWPGCVSGINTTKAH